MRPAELAIGFCTPTSLEAYRRHLRQPDAHEWAATISTDSAVFSNAILKSYEAFAKAARGLGAALIPEVKAGDLQSLFRAEYRAIVLFAHHSRGRMELSDGFAPLAQVIGAVPLDYEGIVDLSVCNAGELARQLRSARPNLGPIKFSNGPVRYDFWLTFYSCLIRVLAANAQLDYWDAHEATMREFLQAFRP